MIDLAHATTIVDQALEHGRTLGLPPLTVAVLDAGHRHAPLDPAPQRALPVERKIMRGLLLSRSMIFVSPSAIGSVASVLPVLRYR